MRHLTIVIAALLIAVSLGNVASAARLQLSTEASTFRIEIMGDGDFCDSSSTGVTNCATADGSAQAPYVISGWSLSASNAPVLSLKNTVAHVIIRDNTFSGSSSPVVELVNASNVVVSHNAFANAGKIAVDVRAGSVSFDTNSFDLVGVAIVARDSTITSTSDTLTRVGSGFRLFSSTADVTRLSMSDDYPCEPGDVCYDFDGMGTVGMALRDAELQLTNSEISIFDTAIFLANGVVSVTATDISEATTAINVNGGDLSISGSNIYNSAWGITNTGSSPVAARNVWWGSATGPSGSGPGAGSGVSSGVLFTPWATTPFTI